jgi:anthranilate phosphoribosyltransferase
MLTPGLLESLAGGRILDSAEAEAVMRFLLDPEASAPQKASVLAFLRARGATAPELSGMARAVRAGGRQLPNPPENVVDTCGTGGGSPSFNISTGAAILASAAGAKVAKHGNRAVTSTCGSADVVRALGLSVSDDFEAMGRRLNSLGFEFLFAPFFYPGMAVVGPLRQELGFRTVFNQLGPLLNPAGARRQVIGVFNPEIGPVMAEAARLLGAEDVWVAHGHDGLDEASPCAPTTLWHATPEGVTTQIVEPADFGISALSSQDIAPADTAQGAARQVEAALTGQEPAYSAALIPTASLALVAAGMAASFAEAGAMAMAAIEDGRASTQLAALRQA